MRCESTGFNFILWGNMVRRDLPPEMLAFIDHVDAAAWYPTEQLLALIEKVRDTHGSARVDACGRAIFYTLKDDLEQLGIHDPRSALLSIAATYAANNRGPDAGAWRVLEDAERRVVLEDRTCFASTLVNMGVAVGAAKAFGGRNVQMAHTTSHDDAQMVHVITVTWE